MHSKKNSTPTREVALLVFLLVCSWLAVLGAYFVITEVL